MKNLIIAIAMIFVPTLASADNLFNNDPIDIEFYNTWEVIPVMTTESDVNSNQANQTFLGAEDGDATDETYLFVRATRLQDYNGESLDNVLSDLMDEDGIVSVDINELLKYLGR